MDRNGCIVPYRFDEKRYRVVTRITRFVLAHIEDIGSLAHFTVTDLAKLRGLSGSLPPFTAMK
jgi:hypothetical protein